MVTYTNNQAPAPTPSDNSGTNAGLIIVAFILIAAIVIGAIYFMNNPIQSTNTNTTTVDRTVSRIEQVPAPAPAQPSTTNTTPDTTTPATPSEPSTTTTTTPQ